MAQRLTGGAPADGTWISSVGIDIGTSTTKMIVSRLKLVRTSSSLSLPRYDITERQLLYASPIHGTPLRSGDEVDAERIWAILAREYEAAGVAPSDLKSGAVIITGETANKKNARQIVHLLAERSGDFVVATAGADLEGLLAGRGAGAEERSKATRGAVANIDVGGGTANAAIFLRGKPVGTVTFHVGGRLIQLDPAAGTVESVSPSLRPWLDVCGYRLEPGRQVGFEVLQDICLSMSRDLLDYMAGVRNAQVSTIAALLLGAPLETVPTIEEWTISGGIGQLMDGPRPGSVAETAVHRDIGPLLAHTIKEQASRYPIRFGRAVQTVRATVIGAGMQTTEISGATVHLETSLLPIRNLPVLKAELTPHLLERADLLSAALNQTIRQGADLFDRDASPPFALALTGLAQAGYAAVQRLSDAICAGYTAYFPDSGVIVVICENDIAKALGQSLERRFGSTTKVICIDQIAVELGDYVDLGEPIAGMMVPVVVKTLAFNKRAGVTYV